MMFNVLSIFAQLGMIQNPGLPQFLKTVTLPENEGQTLGLPH